MVTFFSSKADGVSWAFHLTLFFIMHEWVLLSFYLTPRVVVRLCMVGVDPIYLNNEKEIYAVTREPLEGTVMQQLGQQRIETERYSFHISCAETDGQPTRIHLTIL